MDCNGGPPKGFLSGAEEVEAFNNSEFLKLHVSTMKKAYWLSDILQKIFEGKLHVQHSNLAEKFNKALESTPAKVAGLIATIFAILQGVAWITQ